MRIGELLEKYRRKRTYQDIKNNTGVSKGTYSQIVNGHTVAPDPDTLRRIAFYFGENESEAREIYAELMFAAGYMEAMPARVLDALLKEAAQDLIDEHGVISNEEDLIRLIKIVKDRSPNLYNEIMKGLLPP